MWVREAGPGARADARDKALFNEREPVGRINATDGATDRSRQARGGKDGYRHRWCRRPFIADQLQICSDFGSGSGSGSGFQ